MQPFYNQATLNYQDVTALSNLVRGNIRTALRLTKTPVKDTYVHGEEITYLVSIQNTADSAFKNLTLTDSLGSYEYQGETVTPLTYIDQTLTVLTDGVETDDVTVRTAPHALVLCNIDVPANGNVILAYAVLVNAFAPLGADATVTNTVTLAGAPMSAALTDDATIIAEDGVTLTITKAVDPATVTEGDEITYTFEILNYGSLPATAKENAYITDHFDPALRDPVAIFNGEPWCEGADYAYDPASGLFTSVGGRITVPGATYDRDAETGAWSITPGRSVLTIQGTF